MSDEKIFHSETNSPTRTRPRLHSMAHEELFELVGGRTRCRSPESDTRSRSSSNEFQSRSPNDTHQPRSHSLSPTDRYQIRDRSPIVSESLSPTHSSSDTEDSPKVRRRLWSKPARKLSSRSLTPRRKRHRVSVEDWDKNDSSKESIVQTLYTYLVVFLTFVAKQCSILFQYIVEKISESSITRNEIFSTPTKNSVFRACPETPDATWSRDEKECIDLLDTISDISDVVVNSGHKHTSHTFVASYEEARVFIKVCKTATIDSEINANGLVENHGLENVIIPKMICSIKGDRWSILIFEYHDTSNFSEISSDEEKEICERLYEQTGVRQNDFDGANILKNQNGQFLLFDFGDASISAR